MYAGNASGSSVTMASVALVHFCAAWLYSAYWQAESSAQSATHAETEQLKPSNV